MLDIGFWEILILAALALLILGPERLPHVVRTVGKWVRAIRRTATQLRWQIEQELDVSDKPRPRPPQQRPGGASSSTRPPPDGLTQRAEEPTPRENQGQGKPMDERDTSASPSPRPVEGADVGAQDAPAGVEPAVAESGPAAAEVDAESSPRAASPRRDAAETSRSETSTH